MGPVPLWLVPPSTCPSRTTGPCSSAPLRASSMLAEGPGRPPVAAWSVSPAGAAAPWWWMLQQLHQNRHRSSFFWLDSVDAVGDARRNYCRCWSHLRKVLLREWLSTPLQLRQRLEARSLSRYTTNNTSPCTCCNDSANGGWTSSAEK